MTDPKIVLHVEDEEDHAFLVRRCFAKLESDCELVQVGDGEQAMAYLQSADEARPALVLLDLQLPRMSGLDVLQAIKSDPTLRSIPVVILTTSSAEVDLEGAAARHVNSYLVKPPEYTKLRELLTEVDDYWLKLDRLRDAPDPKAT